MPEPSAFTQKVYAACSQIPSGQVATYKTLAQFIGCKSPRAVGQALRINPYAPEVPCHRVIRSDLSVGGFLGQTQGEQIQRKLRLLAEEGVHFDGEGLLLEADRRLFLFE